VRELLQLVLAGEDVWGNLFGLVLHQDTLWEATVPVAAWMVEALQTERLGNRLIPVRNPSSGRKYVVSERALALELLSSMAEVARDAVVPGSTSKRSAAIGALVLEALRPGIPLYEAGAEDSDDQISEASSALLKALAGRGSGAASDSQYGLSLRANLEMPLPPPTFTASS
jgi:hypothetical protein